MNITGATPPREANAMLLNQHYSEHPTTPLICNNLYYKSFFGKIILFSIDLVQWG